MGHRNCLLLENAFDIFSRTLGFNVRNRVFFQVSRSDLLYLQHEDNTEIAS